MTYGDTSMLVPLFVSEPGSRAVTNWYAAEPGELVVTAWCATEYASALGLKQRTGAIDATQAQEAWGRFKRLVNADLRLLPVGMTHPQ